MLTVATSEEFEEDFSRLDRSEKIIVENIINKLKEQGDCVGKPLSLPFLREKYCSGKRIYYLIYKQASIIILVAVSNKKTQQEVIEKIKSNLSYYNALAETLSKKILI